MGVAWPEATLGDFLSTLEAGNRPRGGVTGIRSGVPSIGAESITTAGEYDFEETKYILIDFYDAVKRGGLEDRDVLLYKGGGNPGESEPHTL